ncbi:NAD(P)/FAD-dependent oxidoreductase [Halobacillus salinarum]|uniref:NAD(P)/FAD-dependent oxidoreductase n=1 Tax=Halobacillus salinarum TaxID=2932257 RepID=A0ABY4EEB8_9BACI|nr:NAD(P)/FAD-dependent oxidoreductase [Halobacillus salinarum]UOQ42820.1 NAD(P)/FAD-dependent oxidoreductase [Halobacillus salinarum]
MYDTIIAGAGIAGLQAAIQLGRYNRKVLAIDSNDGRSTLCRNYHNILGFPDGISGMELRQLGRAQAEQFGVKFCLETVESVHQNGRHFLVKTNLCSYEAKTVVLATGIKDNLPDFEGLRDCLGISVYVCPDCDGFEITKKKTIVIGSGETGARMACTLKYWSNDIVLINHGRKVIPHELEKELKEKNIQLYETKINTLIQENGYVHKVETMEGTVITGERAFVAMGGNEVRSDLAKQIGAEVKENQHIFADSRTKMTTVENVWAIGDIGEHSELVTAAMGEGSIAAIWVHKKLLQ